MPRLTDRHYLRTQQYRDASNLDARILVHQRFSTNGYDWQRWVFDRLDLPERCDILDLGCGPGSLWTENTRRIPAGWRIMMSDLSLGMVQQARRHLSHGHPHANTAVLDAQSLPFPSRHLDAVIANHMLYHIPDLDRALREIRRVLRSGGRLYASTNGAQHLRELRDLVATFCPEADCADVAADFGLENGAALLSRQFTDIALHRREDGLVVTEPEPLIAYARSMMCQTALAQNLESFSRCVRQQISAHGAIRIRKDSGIFEALRA